MAAARQRPSRLRIETEKTIVRGNRTHWQQASSDRDLFELWNLSAKATALQKACRELRTRKPHIGGKVLPTMARMNYGTWRFAFHVERGGSGSASGGPARKLTD